jgi:membrane protein implicated in regulation of membrane protease activity
VQPLHPYLYWLLAAIVLVIAELLTGTFYLLVLGVAAAAGATLAWFNLGFPAQAAFATAIAVVGVFFAHRYRTRNPRAYAGSNAIDIGQRVILDSWVNEAEGLARVSYRGALWDARVIGERGSGTSYYIRGVDGSTLHIAAAPA